MPGCRGLQLAVQRRTRPKQRPWRGIDDLELAVAEYVDWFNHRRLSLGVEDLLQDVA
jgi:hypothetical protein